MNKGPWTHASWWLSLRLYDQNQQGQLPIHVRLCQSLMDRQHLCCFLFQMVLLPATWFNRDCFLFTDLWWTPNCPRIGLRENLLEWPLLQCYKIRGFPFNAPFSSTYWFRDQTRPATRFPPWRGRKRKRSWSPSAPTWPRWTRRPSKPCSRQGWPCFWWCSRNSKAEDWWEMVDYPIFEGDACPEMVDYYPKNPKFSWWNQLIGTSLSHSFPIIFP